jgi:arylsulfatase A-like enzyme
MMHHSPSFILHPPSFILFFLLLAHVHAAAADAPNVLVILTDDQGWGDLSVHGNTNLETPHIDSLARDGVTLEHFYVCHVCAPTRAEFLTGRYYPRTGVSGVSVGRERLNRDEETIADHFRAAGYTTGAFGKWHNGTQPPYHPNNRGFDEFYGFTSGHWGHYFSPPLDSNGKRVRGNGFVVDDCADHAMHFMEANQDRPFFCYVPFNTPHSPMMVPDRFYNDFAELYPAMRHREENREDLMMTRAALALCENIDWNVGRILGKLTELNLHEKTIVVFFSDNGPNSYRWNGGMKGRKGSLDEGGLRSPCFVRWPGRIEAGRSIAPLTAAIDLLPTLTDLAGFSPTHKRVLDGRSLLPLLLGEGAEWEPRTLLAVKPGQARHQVSVRNQRYRLDDKGRLFDLTTDLGQNQDVAAVHPEVAARMLREAAAHRAEMAVSFKANTGRPFTVGFGAKTTLPARDGVPHGTIKRSSKAPNNSFFTHWTHRDDSITWDIEVAASGEFEAIVYYTCAEGDEGAQLRLSRAGSDSVVKQVTEAFDPPLYDKSKERVANSHYFVKDFKSLHLGSLRLQQGRGLLKLDALDIPGRRVIDVHSIELVRR